MYWKDGATKMEENMTKFNEKMATLLETAAKNKNTIKYDEILSEFPEASMDGELFDRILEELEKTRIEILAAIDNEQEPVLLEVEDIDDVDLEEELSNMDISKLDLSIPEGIGLDDPRFGLSSREAVYYCKFKNYLYISVYSLPGNFGIPSNPACNSASVGI